MPRLGGVAIFAGVLGSALLFLPLDGRFGAILLGAAVITVVGALDDVFELSALVKLLGQIGAALIPVTAGVQVEDFTLPFVHRVELGGLGVPLTVAGSSSIMNVVNFSDGVDGLAAGVCAIAPAAFVVIAFDLERATAAVLAAIIAGAALGFLVHNFHPATVFMGDCGSNLLGLLLACVAVEGTVKTQAVLALVLPLVVLAVPFLDTTFVVLKRLKYRRPVYDRRPRALPPPHGPDRLLDAPHRALPLRLDAHARRARARPALRALLRQRRAPARRAGRRSWPALGLIALAASVYLVYVLEILKFKRLDAMRLRRLRPDATEEEIDADVARAPRDRRVRRRAPRDRGVRSPEVLIRPGPDWALPLGPDARLPNRRGRAVHHDRRLDDPRARGARVAAVAPTSRSRRRPCRSGRDTDEHYHPIGRGDLLLPDAAAGGCASATSTATSRPGDCVLIAPGVIHKLVNTGDEPLRLLCCCAPPWTPEDTILTGG